jgi:hypothetical protein
MGDSLNILEEHEVHTIVVGGGFPLEINYTRKPAL